jgi:cephalosporin hydroxylase
MIEVGSFRPVTTRRALNPVQRVIARAFHRLYYRAWQRGTKGPSPATLSLHWFGHQMIKCPLDLWIYQEIIVETRPDVVIETGTFRGGTTLFIAMLLDALGHGRVVTIDPHAYDGRPAHPRIRYLAGSSTAPETLAELHRDIRQDERSLVILDSDHSERHVATELRLYRDFVPPGSYLIVEDSNVNGHPVMRRHGPGPMEAIRAFLAQDDRFEADATKERFLLTMNPNGYLRRIR